MSTILFDSPIFGPVNSRRLGVSLGINLLPANRKVCSFDCIYCECGRNADFRGRYRMPSPLKVYDALEMKLREMRMKGTAPDVITFAGNGEPTLHPHFDTIVDDTLALRDRYFPDARVSVLSNAAHLKRSSVFKTLNKVDYNILKLDTVNSKYIRFVNRPSSRYSLHNVIGRLKAFHGRCIIQTMFLKGRHDGWFIDNTTDEFVLPWIEAVKEIAPRQVMIYTIERETPGQDLRKASPEELERILSLLHNEGIYATSTSER